MAKSPELFPDMTKLMSDFDMSKFTWIGTAKGFFLHRARQAAFGAEGVARITTEAVVLSSIAILFGDYLVGALML